jgi:hypothetical protein
VDQKRNAPSLCDEFQRYGVCSLGSQCSFAHPLPSNPRCIVFRSLFQPTRSSFSSFTDDALERADEFEEEKNRLKSFCDALHEEILNHVSQVMGMVVALNDIQLARGNVYAELPSKKDAEKVLEMFRGKYIGAKPYRVSFIPMEHLEDCLCSSFLYGEGRSCALGRRCRSIHAFIYKSTSLPAKSESF